MANPQTILVTGGSGQLGNELKTLVALYPQYEFLFPSRLELNIENFDQVKNFFLSAKPAFCINGAAYTAVDQAEADRAQAFLVNGDAVGNLSVICRECNTRLVHISTDYVFDGTATVPYTEEMATNPVNLYGASKLEGEKKAWANNPDSIIVRTSWVYSPFGKNFVRTMLRLMKEKPQVRVVNDQFGCPTYAADLAAVILQIIQSGKWQPGIFHFSNEGIISWFDFARAIQGLSHSQCEVVPVPATEYPTPAKRPAWSVLSNKKIVDTYRIIPMPWKESLVRCLGRIG